MIRTYRAPLTSAAAISSPMAYWWASQNKNWWTAIPDGTLWTRPKVNGVMPVERRALQLLEPDDIVFHYGAPHVRAVSRVVAPAIDWKRPPNYPRNSRETEANDDGKLARVEVIEAGLTLHRDRVAELISWGSPGPFHRNGGPREAYITPLPDTEADALLAELRVFVPNRTLPGRPHADWSMRSGVTDTEATAQIRREQGALRAHLLAGAERARCGICGRDIPSAFLIAGHILPRSELTDEQRWNFESAAMLVCLFGCDALFENGYVVVNREGVVSRGRSTEDLVVEDEANQRVGTKSEHWIPSNAGTFRLHELRHRLV